MTDDPARTRTLEPAPTAKAQRARVPGVLAVWGPGAAAGALVVRKPVTIGRDPDAHLELDDDGASRAHAELASDRGALVVRDRQSRNGTFVDGVRVEGEARASIGSVIRIGRTLLVVVADATAYRGARDARSDGMVGGPSLDAVRAEIRAVAGLSTPILVEGESGTGKELVAAALHAASGRRGELVAVNCAALPADIVESELFGHARGAFSGAERARAGLFARASGGTLFLDEMGELPPGTQAKLLRVLEDGVVRAVGEDRGRALDVRVVAATHRNLSRLVEAGSFRLDLFHRIAATRVRLPSLRERLEDVPLLVRHFAGAGALPGTDAMQALLAHRWSGNVRELRHVLATAQARARAEGASELSVAHLGLEATRTEPADGDEAIRARLEDALREAGGNVMAAARALGQRRAGVYEDMRRLGIDPERFRRR